jgi:hypothetical protein
MLDAMGYMNSALQMDGKQAKIFHASEDFQDDLPESNTHLELRR